MQSEKVCEMVWISFISSANKAQFMVRKMVEPWCWWTDSLADRPTVESLSCLVALACWDRRIAVHIHRAAPLLWSCRSSKIDWTWFRCHRWTNTVEDRIRRRPGAPWPSTRDTFRSCCSRQRRCLRPNRRKNRPLDPIAAFRNCSAGRTCWTVVSVEPEKHWPTLIRALGNQV